MLNRESELKRHLRLLQEQRGDIEDDLQSARAELDSARNSGPNQVFIKAPEVHPETQAEIDRLQEALERTEKEALQLRHTNDNLVRVNTDDIKVCCPSLHLLFFPLLFHICPSAPLCPLDF